MVLALQVHAGVVALTSVSHGRLAKGHFGLGLLSLEPSIMDHSVARAGSDRLSHD